MSQINQESVEIIPKFQTLFNEIEVDQSIIQELAKHNPEDQHQIFHAFKQIFQDELLFVLTVFQKPQQYIS
ncbi:hypothetical protein M3685_12965 [Heyndrickxia oleronia]|uniref:Uncharacterized protein n=1 Tax=Heyndrickxia oleronia TaxID=38875 RepID=A0AAW6SZ67_9BACI|nr:hypothetical protein [Heyndrickxia oleronia]NYV66604.1 hypothetical protein [Bacillus sp. Gen3]MCM3240766.1 hypothetical protein [Heyndrickxia oleronia]MCM3454831.1 hypothetical protein [Heyndrickxia oleronia]MDH5163430.1 hypothetical protein [Heyndrickxia oleronia]GIN41461.1 hypothetical protein J19TS1_44100 [Heyndrickxia oleronia]